MIDHSDKAIELFQSGQSCSNAVFRAYCEYLGIDEDTAARIAGGFGGGIGGRGELCGAVAGMVMCGTIGIPADDKTAIRANVSAMVDEFLALYGTTTCKELKALADQYPPTEPGQKKCDRYVKSAAQIVCQHIKGEDK